jgi:hypothetical protein
MTLTSPINLIGYTNPRLTFYTKYDIESDWDYGQVEISNNNGSTWIPLQGKYTNTASGSFQPTGEPLYDGTRTDWVREEISLAPYVGNQFELKSDGSVQRDGWYIDDIGIMYYSVASLELTSFNALIEGFYDGSTMKPDTILVELRNSSYPYSLVDQAKIFLNNSGQGTAKFYNAINGTPYYLVLRHRNAIETWSAVSQTFMNGILTYDFTTGSNKAYGNNLKLVGSKCIYSGDVNQDGFIDIEDLNAVYNENISGVTGYHSTDVTGDLFTEIGDLSLTFINKFLGVERKRPIDFPSKQNE